jgi:hypothetical protein
LFWVYPGWVVCGLLWCNFLWFFSNEYAKKLHS